MSGTSSLILFLNILVFVVGISIISRSLRWYRRAEVFWLLVLVCSICLVSFCGLNVYVSNVFENKVFFSRLRFVGLSMLPPAWLLFMMATYGSSHWIFRSRVLLLVLFPASLTALFSLVPQWNDLVVKNFEPFFWQGVSLVSYENGAWFSVHMLSSTIYALGALIFALVTAYKSEGVKKRQLLTLFWGGFISLTVDRYAVSFDQDYRWAMLGGATFVFTEGAILYAIVRHGLLDLSDIAKNKIFNEIPDPLVILDKSGQIMDFNTAAGKLFSMSGKDLLKVWRAPWKQEPDKYVFEWSLQTEGRVQKHFLVRLVPLNDDYFLGGTIVALKEFTDQKIVELELNNHLEFKARLLSLIAHDFSGFLDAQAKLTSSLSSETAEDVAALKFQTNLLKDSMYASADFMRNILMWAQSQVKQFEPFVKPFEMNILVKDIVEAQQSLAALKMIKMQVSSSAKPIIVEGDSMMIESVLRNLLHNALRASNECGLVQIHIAKEHNSVVVSIQDNGCGMSQTQLSSLKSPTLGALEPVERKTEGFGIGLSIAKKFVELHRGKIEAESQLDQGTCITVTLPL